MSHSESGKKKKQNDDEERAWSTHTHKKQGRREGGSKKGQRVHGKKFFKNDRGKKLRGLDIFFHSAL